MRDSVRQVFESVRCEAYGPGGAALIIDCLTADRALTVERLRQALLRYGGQVGARGSVSYLFNPVGRMVYGPPGRKHPEGDFRQSQAAAERLIRAAFEAGAEDVVSNPDGSIDVLTDPIEFELVQARLREKGHVPVKAEVTERASTSVRLNGEAASAMKHLLATLEDLDDVQNVYTNVEIPDEVLARF